MSKELSNISQNATKTFDITANSDNSKQGKSRQQTRPVNKAINR